MQCLHATTSLRVTDELKLLLLSYESIGYSPVSVAALLDNVHHVLQIAIKSNENDVHIAFKIIGHSMFV